MLAIFVAHPSYWLVLGIGLVLSLWAAARVKGTFARYSQVRARSGVTGAQVAQAILQANGIHDVRVEPVRGSLSDHYDPSSKPDAPQWFQVDVRAVAPAARTVGLPELRTVKGLEKMELLRKGSRLSVQFVRPEEWAIIEKLAK